MAQLLPVVTHLATADFPMSLALTAAPLWWGLIDGWWVWVKRCLFGFLWVSDFLSGALHRDGSPCENGTSGVDPIPTSD